MHDKLTDEVAQVIKSTCNLEEEIPVDVDLYSEVGIESTNVLSILLTLEEKFAISIDDTQFIRARTLSKLVKIIRKAATD